MHNYECIDKNGYSKWHYKYAELKDLDISDWKKYLYNFKYVL